MSKKQVLGSIVFFCALLVILGSVLYLQRTNTQTKAAPGVVYYVATNGNDTFSGTSLSINGTNGPFRTMKRARDAIRSLKQSSGLPDGGVAVYIRGGVYELNSTVDFTTQDSGTATSPVIYSAYNGEQVRIIGGRRLDPNKFTPITNQAVLNRILDVADKSQLSQYDLRADGFQDYGEVENQGSHPNIENNKSGMELFFNNQRMQLARWPNRPQWEYTRLVNGDKNAVLPGRFHFDSSRPSQWDSFDDLHAHVWLFDYADFIDTVATFDTAQKLVILRLDGNTSFEIRGDRRFAILNVLDEMNVPGEYYIDRTAGILYFYPPSSLQGSDMYVSLVDNIFFLNGASYITFEGLTLEGGRQDGIRVFGGSTITIAGNTVRNQGHSGIWIDQNGSGHKIQSNNVYNLAANGIFVDGSNIIVDNNDVHNFQQWRYWRREGITFEGDNITVTHNHIHHAPNTGVWFGAANSRFEFNEVDNLTLESGDTGGLHTSIKSLGNSINYNYWHHIDPNKYRLTRGQIAGEGAQGIYLDDFASNFEVVGNIIDLPGRRGMFLNSGRNNHIQNNLILRGDPYGVYLQYRYWEGNTDAKPINNQIIKNIFQNNPTAIYPDDQENYFNEYPKTEFCANNQVGNMCQNAPVNYLAPSGENLGISYNSQGRITAIDNAVITKKLPEFAALKFDQMGLYNDKHRSVVSPTLVPLPHGPDPIVTVNPNNTRFAVTVFLHGIGKGGDNVNPSTTGNTNPIRMTRLVSIDVFNANNQYIMTGSGSVTYNGTSGNFQGVLDMQSLPTGQYTIRIQIPHYLRRSIPGIISVSTGQQVALPPITLVTGDSNADNALSILDYNIVLDCFSDLTPAKNCSTNAKKLSADLTDDGNVNQFDYNLFLREISVQTGE